MSKRATYWITDLQGMNQRFDMDKIPDGQSPLLVNISCDKPGTWSKRKGNRLLAVSKVAAYDGVQALQMYSIDKKLRALRSGIMYNYSEGTDSWVRMNASAVTSPLYSQTVNFKRRVYYADPGIPIYYETGTTKNALLDPSGNTIYAQSIAVAQSSLFAGGITFLTGAPFPENQTDRVYYSRFDAALNTVTDELYEVGALDYQDADKARWFSTIDPCVGVFSFGTTGLCYAFTEDKCYSFDLSYAENSTGVQGVFDIGLANPRAICQCNGLMIWMDPEARIWAWGGEGVPSPLSWVIEDDGNAEAILNSVTRDNIDKVAAGATKNTFFFTIGDVTYRGETISNAFVQGLFSQNSQSCLLTIGSLPHQVSIFANAVINDKRVLTYGTFGFDDVYVMQDGINDGDQAIEASAKTKFFDFGAPSTTKPFTKLHIKYKPQLTKDTFLTVRYAIDGNYNYTDLSSPEASEPITKHGVIDMYDPLASTKTDAIKTLTFPNNARGRNISIEISNGQVDRDFEISGIGFDFDVMDLDTKVNSK